MKAGRLVAVGCARDVITEENLKELYGVKVRVIQLDEENCGREQAVIPLLEKRRPGSAWQTD
jgi:ABC-type cobalamin/Fe3+-siderophores transport system ATPase subunit